ncbi:Uncharacterized protein BP5553_08701 [Venustampulla echinocandica]|uniref:Uncharacterized protein n=1 Tax=Venustampulla echinocandica TaxID=2656787 RepID=A0A370TEZ6_9HELO|nr:Uncharacterized protein BP5553_08701 [Venustampulla echinocandica]RDL33262.1 Uncharacterized protein BP5553_08701 [Venustampulla echinocandica]
MKRHEAEPQPQYAQTKDASPLSRRRSVRMNKGKIMRKLLGQPAPSAIENTSVDHGAADSPQLRPSASQNTTYAAGAPIACLDRSSDGSCAVIAGTKVFKVLRIDGPTITEELDLRSAITSYATSHDLSAATPDQLNIKAVKWSHGALDTSIITASGNGRITVYDLNRVGEGLETARIHEHARQVHKLAINPFMCNWLLSASQDGTVRSFDIRTPFVGRNGPTFRTWQTFKCNADAVRDVMWSPTDGMEFACCTDAGVVQKWDIRKPSAPVLKLTAHQSPCFSISWHPDGDHLTSGGADQFCHVWDLSKKADRNQKPRYSFATPAPISTVSWRPACWSATAQGRRAAQIAVAYDDTSITRNQTSSVDLWDLARPSMPFKQIDQWDSSPTGILWNSRDLLWAVDREGRFTQTDVVFAPKAIDRRSLSSFSFSASGDVLMLLEERQIPQRRSRPSIKSPEVSPNFQPNSSAGTLMSVSQTDSEEDVVGSFLGPRQRKTHRRRNSARSTQSFSSTPPSNTGIVDSKVMSLDDALKVTGIYKPQQVMAIGHAPSTANRHTYQYFSNRYLIRMEKDNFAKYDFTPTNVRMTSTTEHFARTAEAVGHYRLAQTWRLVGYTMNILLTRRAEYHRQSRLAVPEPPKKADKQHKLKQDVAALQSKIDHDLETPRRQPRAQTPQDSPLQRPTRSTVMADAESTSNVATPLARPVDDDIVDRTREAMLTPITVDDDVLNLPEAAHSTSPSPIPVPGAEVRTSSIEGYDFYGMETFSPPIVEFHPPQRKQPLRLDDFMKHNRSPENRQLSRHDSGESFQMFSTSNESHQAKFLSSSESDAGRSLPDRVSGREDSSSFNPSNSEAPSQSDSSYKHPPTNSDQSNGDKRNEMRQSPTNPPILRLQEASMQSTSNSDELNTPEEESVRPPSGGEVISEDPNIVESDYLPWPNDPHFTVAPIDPSILVQRSIDFETKTSALNAAAMVLLLRPFLPASAIDEIQAGAILRQYHHRLTSMKLFMEAALLRNLCVPLYPSVFAPAQENITIGYFCTSCQKPLENDPLIPNSVWHCPRCERAIEGCAVCRHRELDPDLTYEDQDASSLESLALWWLCPGCGHGGHTTCMQAWHSGPEFDEGSKVSGGCCPLEGCLHPCLPGTWRAQRWEEKKMAKARELESLVRESSRAGARAVGVGRGGVRRDNREVNQSKAVEGVRVALGVGVGGATDRGPGLERKKSVKLVAPGEEGG